MANDITPHNPLEGDRPDLTLNLSPGAIEEQISIIIVHKDKPSYLSMCLQSITVTSFNNNYEIIVVDNGSDKESQAWLDEIETSNNGAVKIVRNKTNLYWSAAANQGVKAASKNSKYYVFLHADVVILNPSWLDILINIAESKNSGLVGTEINTYKVGKQRVDFIQEWCLLMTKECFKEIGPWPEELPQIGHSFVMTLRAAHFGFSPQASSNAIAHHYGVFGIGINEYEKLQETAMVTIPKLISTTHSTPVGK